MPLDDDESGDPSDDASETEEDTGEDLVESVSALISDRTLDAIDPTGFSSGGAMGPTLTYDTEPIPPANIATMVCLQGVGGCRHYLEKTIHFDAENASGSLEKEPRETVRFCMRIPGHAIDLGDEVIYECNQQELRDPWFEGARLEYIRGWREKNADAIAAAQKEADDFVERAKNPAQPFKLDPKTGRAISDKDLHLHPDAVDELPPDWKPADSPDAKP